MLEEGNEEMAGLFEDQDGENQTDQGNNDDQSQTADGGDGAAAKTKRKIVRNPQPKLDHERLVGQRGLPVLPKMFENVQYKGKGHEKEDLKEVLHVLEHWAHRLFPPMPFGDVLSRIEFLGKKRQVRTCLHRIRSDMPILDEDFTADAQGPGEEERPGSAGSQHSEHNDDIFDQLIRENEVGQESEPLRSQSPVTGSTAMTSISLTDEQRERMEANRRQAAERLAARNRAIHAAAVQSENEDAQQINGLTENISRESNNEEMDVDELDSRDELDGREESNSRNNNSVAPSEDRDNRPESNADDVNSRRSLKYISDSSDDDDTRLVMNI